MAASSEENGQVVQHTSELSAEEKKLEEAFKTKAETFRGEKVADNFYSVSSLMWLQQVG